MPVPGRAAAASGDPVWPLSLPAAVNLPTAPSSPGRAEVDRRAGAHGRQAGTGLWALHLSPRRPVVNRAAVAAKRDRLRGAARQPGGPAAGVAAAGAILLPAVGGLQRRASATVRSTFTGGQRRRILVEPHQQPAHGVCAAAMLRPRTTTAAQAHAVAPWPVLKSRCRTRTPSADVFLRPEPSYTSQPSLWSRRPIPPSRQAPQTTTASATMQPTVPAAGRRPGSQPVDAGAAIGNSLDGRQDRPPTERSSSAAWGAGDGQDRRGSRFARPAPPGCPGTATRHPRPGAALRAPAPTPPARPAPGPVPQLTDRRRGVHCLVLKPLNSPCVSVPRVVGLAGGCG